jgi:hypothetical protein
MYFNSARIYQRKINTKTTKEKPYNLDFDKKSLEFSFEITPHKRKHFDIIKVRQSIDLSHRFYI